MSSKVKKIAIILLLVAVAFDLVFLAFPLGSNPEASPRKQKLKIGMMPIMDCLQLYVAQDRGYFKEEGLEVDLVPMAGGATIAPAVGSGNLDIGWSNSVSIIVAHDKGFGYQFITPGAFRDSKRGIIEHHLVVRSDAEISSYQDLAGKELAINTFGNINELVLAAWLDEHNLSRKQVSLVEVPFPQMEVALENNKIDAALIIEPFATLSAAHNTTRLLAASPYDAVGERLMIASWFARENRLNNNRQAVNSFVSAIKRASKYINAHPDQLPAIISNHTKLDRQLAKKATIPLFAEKLKREELQVLIEAAHRYGFIDSDFDAKEIIDNRSLSFSQLN